MSRSLDHRPLILHYRILPPCPPGIGLAFCPEHYNRQQPIFIPPMDTLTRAVRLYHSIIDDLTLHQPDGNFGALGDSLFESARFYSYGSLRYSFDYSRAVVHAAEKVDRIERLLMDTEREFSLFPYLLSHLKSVAPRFNGNGKTLFLASWGASPGEVGWSIRHLNDRETFERYLKEAGISEAEVDIYNAGFMHEIDQVEPLDLAPE